MRSGNRVPAGPVKLSAVYGIASLVHFAHDAGNLAACGLAHAVAALVHARVPRAD